MNALGIIAANEFLDGLRNRWVATAIILLGAMALILLLTGSAPTGTTRAGVLDIGVVSLSSLSVYLIPLIALLLSFDALVGEFERGTMLLLLTYPVTRWQVVMGKFLGQMMILFAAVTVGFGLPAVAVVLLAETGSQSWQAYITMMGSSLVLGAVFIALAYLVSVLVRERSTAVGASIMLWLVLVVLYDLALLGLLLADEGQRISQTLFSALILVNPTDLYRLLNLTAYNNIGQLAGIAARAEFGPLLLLGLMVMWIIVPLVATISIFQRREL